MGDHLVKERLYVELTCWIPRELNILLSYTKNVEENLIRSLRHSKIALTDYVSAFGKALFLFKFIVSKQTKRNSLKSVFVFREILLFGLV